MYSILSTFCFKKSMTKFVTKIGFLVQELVVNQPLKEAANHGFYWKILGLRPYNKNGSKGARTPDLSRVRRTLIPAELCFHVLYCTTA